MTKCKANSCYNSPNYSWENYCSYHERCLSKLREYRSINDIRKIETFTTWFNGNCGWVVNYDYSSSSLNPYFVWIVVYEPAVKSIGENLKVIKYNNYPSLGTATGVGWSIKLELQNSSFDATPTLKIHPKANSYETFGSLTNSDYVKESVLPYETDFDFYKHCTCYPTCDCYGICDCTKTDIIHTRVNNPERYLKPLDIIKVSEGIYEHAGVYLGRINGEHKVCNYSKKYEGTKTYSLDRFLKDYRQGNGKITCYHPIIPFKYYQKIARQIAWVNDVNFRANNYSLGDRNCEHFANMIVYGINYSQQVENSSLINIVNWNKNNGKGSTIKLTNEMSESESRLGWKTNNLSKDIEEQYRQEVPPKHPCRIM